MRDHLFASEDSKMIYYEKKVDQTFKDPIAACGNRIDLCFVHTHLAYRP